MTVSRMAKAKVSASAAAGASRMPRRPHTVSYTHLSLLQRTCRETGMTVIIITHNSSIIPMGDRVIRIKNGQVTEQRRNEQPLSVDQIEW